MIVFVGYDPREHEAYRVCRYSIKRWSPMVEVRPIILSAVKGIWYWREKEPGSTEFSITRFLTPFLAACAKHPTALFVDCDFVFTKPVDELFGCFDPTKALQVVKHEFDLREVEKMDGAPQVWYPRKWWSAMILWNVRHTMNQELTLEDVSVREPAWMHRFGWLPDELIGDLPATWHWLDGYSPEPLLPHLVSPAGIHLTKGGPWFKDRQWVGPAHDLWCDYHAMMLRDIATGEYTDNEVAYDAARHRDRGVHR
jgi:hypothetical protein